MRRSALFCALVRSSLPLSFALPIAFHSAHAQEVAASGTAEVASSSEQLAAAEPAPNRDEERREQLLRRGASYLGPVGGIHVIEAGSGAPGSFRLQLVTDFFFKRDYLYNDDNNRYVGGAFSLGFTPIEHLELTAAVTARSNRNSKAEDELLQTFGDPHFNVKSYGEVAKGVTLGGDVLVSILTKAGTDDLAYAGTSVGLRANLSLDLRRMPANVPLELRLNAGYVFDDSSSIVKSLERDRLTRLVAAGQTADPSGRNEVQQLARREERLAYGINRVDHASIAVGLEAPLKLSKKVALHPIAEWELWVPVNRQDFDCATLRFPDGRRVPGQDDCLANEKLDTWPQRVTAGARLYPALGGFSLLAAVELGVGGTTHFVRELAPSAPYKIYAAAAYVVDYKPKPPVTVVKQVETRVEVPVAPKEGRVRGRVVEQGAGVPVANARISFPRRELSPLLSGNDGEFVSYAFAPGNIWMEIEAEGYRSGSCNVQIAPEGGDTPGLCELVALPRVGSAELRVVDNTGLAVAGTQVAITGPTARNPITDASGRVNETDLPPGDYQVRIESPDHMLSFSWFHVDARKQTTSEIRLTPRPKKPLVTVQKTKLVLKGTIFFNTNTADLDPRSEPLVAEIADVLLRTPQIRKVEIRGHTDAVGTPDYNMDLSQRRADTILNHLRRAGVEGDRLVARGFGATKPVVPNISERNRAKNRRVEFVIVERATP